MAMDVSQNEPSIFVEGGGKLWKLTQCVNEACKGAAKGYDTSWDIAKSPAPQHATAFLKSRNATKNPGQ
eukprot:6009165-Alexandrium_andersonii.AAC.1